MMILASTKVRFITALSVLGLAAAWAAATVSTVPEYKGADLRQIVIMQESLAGAVPVSTPLNSNLIRAARQPDSGALSTPEKKRPQVRVTSAEQPRTEPKKPAGGSTSAGPTTVPAAAESPVKNIALLGVTSQGGTEEAWLIDVASMERETAAEGAEAFGFKVREIEAESVLLARGDEQFEIHLGEKPIPTPEPDPASTEPAPGTPGFRGGNGGDRAARWAARAAAFTGGGRSFNRGNRNWGGGGGGRSFGGGSSSFNRGGGGNFNRGGGNSNRGGARFSTSYAAPASYGGGFNRNQTRTQAAGPTSNPQTARRRGGQLVGGASPLPTPSALSNPQTTRRTGTNSGPAFGSGNNNNRGGSNNRTGNNRNR